MLIEIYFLAILGLEIKFMIFANKEQNKKFFKVFNGLFLGFFISIFLYCLYSYSDIFSYDTGEWVTLGALIKSAIFCILNLIIGLIGLISQKRTKKKQFSDTSKKGNTIKYILIVLAFSLILITSQYIIKYNKKIKIENEIKNETMIYLKNKYGSSDFKIVDINRDYAENGFIGTDYLENYDIYAVYLPDNIRFYIYLDVDDSRNILKSSFDDRLISTNYSEKYFKDTDFKNNSNKAMEDLNEYLKGRGLNANINLYNHYVIGLDNNKAVPNDYGRIPSKEELYELILNYHVKHDFCITIDKYEMKSDDLKSEVRKYLIKLSNYLIDYYNDLDDYEIYCKYNDNNGNFFKGRLTINKEYININGNLMNEEIKR